jgi:hypothetical protein
MLFFFFFRGSLHVGKACGGSGGAVQTKTFVVDFGCADEARWEALLEELKPIEVGVLGTSYFALL